MFQTLRKQISGSLQLRTAVTFEKFPQVSYPYIVRIGPFEQFYAFFVSLLTSTEVNYNEQ